MLLSGTGQNILKTLHLVAVSYWLGGSLPILILTYAAPFASTDDELFGMLRASMFINKYIVINLGSLGTFFTGLAYSLCTNRGFFRFKWIIIKWIITVGMIVFGFLFLGQWAGQELDAIQTSGLAAFNQPDIQRIHVVRLYASQAYTALLLLAVMLSVFKPWERQELARDKLLRVNRRSGSVSGAGSGKVRKVYRFGGPHRS